MKNRGDGESRDATQVTWRKKRQFWIELLGDGRWDPWWPSCDESDSAFPGGTTREIRKFGSIDDNGGRLLSSDQSQDDGGSRRLAAASATGAANDPGVDDSVNESVRDGADRQDSWLLPWRMANWHMCKIERVRFRGDVSVCVSANADG
jgi:hypothetical protein